MTNGERARQSDENLVELFFNNDYPWCDDQCEIDATGTVLYCERCFLKWLKQEVQECSDT